MPTSVLLGLTQIESGGREGLRSGAGARGLTQFIDSTARQYHVNTRPGHARSQFKGAAHYLSDLIGQTGSLRSALAAYNAGPGNIAAGRGYAQNVLAASRGYKGAARRANRRVGPGQGRGVGGAQRGSVSVSATGTAGQLTPATPGGTGLADYLRGQLGSSSRPQVAASSPSELQFSARAALPFAGSHGPQLLSGGPVRSTSSVDDALAQIQQLQGGTVPSAQGGSINTATTVTQPGVGAGGRGGRRGIHAGGGWAGSKGVIQTARRVAAAHGAPVTSAKRATKLTASNNPSDHWVGSKSAFAYDFGATGRKGDVVASRVAAAYGVHGYRGGYWLNHNVRVGGRVYRIQIGWKVPDHYDHVHVGVKRV